MVNINRKSALWKYAEAVEAYEEMLDKMNITDPERLTLKSTFHYLENLQAMMLVEEESLEHPYLICNNSGFVCQTVQQSGHRSIKGRDIIDWIDDNDLIEADISCTEDSLLVTMIDAEDSMHIRQLRLSWNATQEMYETVDNQMQSN